MKYIHALALLAAAMLASVGAQASNNTLTNTTTPPASAGNPDLKHNDHVTLSGSVDKIINEDEFLLNYGTGTIKVDTNDSWPEIFKTDKENKTGNTYMLKVGDHVTVSGRVDKNWIKANEIEAETVTYTDGNYIMTFRKPHTPGWVERNLDYFRKGGKMSASGTVTEVKNSHEFILQYAGGDIQVDTSGIDIPKSSPITVGERMTVYGTFDKGIIERNELQAEAIDRGEYYTRISQ